MDNDLNAQISASGWNTTKLKFDKNSDRFIAEAESPHGETVEAFGPSDDMALKNLLGNVLRMNQMRMGSARISRWKSLFTSELQSIAQAYSKAPVYQQKASIAFLELGKDCVSRAHALTEHLQIAVVNNPEPYKDAKAMSEDVRQRRRLQISRAGIEHPVWSEEETIAFRACFDVYGYCAANSDWGWEGTNLAFSYFAPLVSVEAQKALFTETIAYTAYVTYYRAYSSLKVVLFPQFMGPIQDEENPHGGYPGIHPSQIMPPVEKPAIKPLAGFGADADYRVPFGQKLAQGLLRDPNEGWTSPVQEPLPINGRIDYGDPLQAKEGQDNAALINTEWEKLNQEEPQELEKMRGAIENAFRVVLLSPLKDLRFNAVHYQDLMDVRSDNPSELFNHLDKKREEWNVSRFGEQARYEHKPYIKEWRQLENLFYQHNPEAGYAAAKQEADEYIFRMRTRFQNQLIAQAPNPDKLDMYKVDLKAAKMVQDDLKAYLQPHAEWDEIEGLEHNPGQMQLAAIQEKMMDLPQDQIKYAGFIGNHLKAIAQIRQHIDELLKAALEDVRQGGKGYIFRSTVLQLGITGVGPKVASFAWLLLQPLTSELATIDTHMAQFLGYNPNKDLNTRDYFRMEREFRTGMDAAGYHDVPLGMGQWMAWDYKRSGPGTHQDHSAMKVLDPVPHQDIDWASHANTGDTGAYQPPQWWMDTQPARQQVADQWTQDVAKNVNKNTVPWNLSEPAQVFANNLHEAAIEEREPPVCPDCNGDGVIEPTLRDCPRCQANGYLPWYFHLAPTSERNRIQAHGLLPSAPIQSGNWPTSPWVSQQPTGVYLSEYPDTVREGMAPVLGEAHDVWRVHPYGVIDPHRDRAWDDTYTRSPIGPEHLKLAEGPEHRISKITKTADAAFAPEIGNSNFLPFFIHPETQEQIAGKPGQTIASHLQQFGFPLNQIWQFSDQAVGKVPQELLHLGKFALTNPEEAPLAQPAIQHSGQLPDDQYLMGPINIEKDNLDHGQNKSYWGNVNGTPVIVKDTEGPKALINERAAYFLAHHMGVPVPRTVISSLNENPVMVQERIDGEPANKIFYNDAYHQKMPLHARQMQLFDDVTGNYDRSMGNVVLNRQGQPHLIDHELAFEDEDPALWHRYHGMGRVGTPLGNDLMGEHGSPWLTEQENAQLQRAYDHVDELRHIGMPEKATAFTKWRIGQMLDKGRFLRYTHPEDDQTYGIPNE